MFKKCKQEFSSHFPYGYVSTLNINTDHRPIYMHRNALNKKKNSKLFPKLKCYFLAAEIILVIRKTEG